MAAASALRVSNPPDDGRVPAVPNLGSVCNFWESVILKLFQKCGVEFLEVWNFWKNLEFSEF